MCDVSWFIVVSVLVCSVIRIMEQGARASEQFLRRVRENKSDGALDAPEQRQCGSHSSGMRAVNTQ